MAEQSQAGTFIKFAHFLRQYLSAWPVLIACLIGPITKYLHLVPMYKDHENVLACVTALYGFLLAAALFFYRPVFIRPQRALRRLLLLLPALLLAASIGSFFEYTVRVQVSIRAQRANLAELVDPAQLSAEQILARTDFTNIPGGNALLGWYLATFLAAETSLVVMALSEYVAQPRPAA